MHIKSKYFLKPIVLNWTVGILAIADIFLSRYIPHESRLVVETFLACVYTFLFLWALFYFFFKSFDKWDIASQCEMLENEMKLNQEDTIDRMPLLLEFSKIREEIGDKNIYFYFLKTKIEFTNISNIANYLMVLLIIFVSQFSFDYIKPTGTAIFLTIIISCAIFCIRILIWEGLERKHFISNIIMGHAFAICLLFVWGKHSFIRSYGDEILGSYFEKPEYKAQYYVNVFSNENGSKNYRLSADIHVYSETEESESSEDRFGQEYIELILLNTSLSTKCFGLKVAS